MPEIILSPDPASTWGASEEYRAAWFAKYGADLGVFNRLTYNELALAALAARTNSQGDAMLVSGSKNKWRREFVDPTLAEWDVTIGSGQSVTAGVGTNGELRITTGTTANAETVVTSKQSFTAPFRAAFGFKISQKIANQEFYMEVVGENDDGTLNEEVVAAWRIAGSDSVTTTIARTEVSNGGGLTRAQSANLSSQATQTTAAGTVYEITLEADEVWFHSKLADSIAARSTPSVRNSSAPDPNRRYRVRYRVKNGATAPASNTTMTGMFVTCIDYTEQQVEVSGGNGSIGAAQAIPVYNTGGSAGSVSMTSTGIHASATVTGLLVAKVLSAASTNPTVVKNAASRLYGYTFINNASTVRYLKFYNQATAPTVGTSVPVMVIPIPPNGGIADFNNAVPVSFLTGMSYAITAGPADNDTAAVGANDVVGHILYI